MWMRVSNEDMKVKWFCWCVTEQEMEMFSLFFPPFPLFFFLCWQRWDSNPRLRRDGCFKPVP